jgi:hypothetical protein
LVPIILILPALIVIWLIVYFVYYRYNDRQILKNYKVLKDKYSLKLDTSKKTGQLHIPISEGVFKDLPVVVGTDIQYNSRKKKIKTFVKITCSNPDSMAFSISERVPKKKILYSSDIQPTGDSEIDGKYIIKCSDFKKMFTLLNFSIKYKLAQLANVGFKGDIALRENSLLYSEPGMILTNLDLLRIELMMHLLCEISDELKYLNEA